MSDRIPILEMYVKLRQHMRTEIIPDEESDDESLRQTPSGLPSPSNSSNESAASRSPSPRIGRSPSPKEDGCAVESFELDEYYYRDRSLSPSPYVDKRVVINSLFIVIPEGEFNEGDVQIQTNLLFLIPKDISTRIMCISMGIDDGRTMEFGQLSRILREEVRELREDVNALRLSFEASGRKLTELDEQKKRVMAAFTPENFKIFRALQAPKEQEPNWVARQKNRAKDFDNEIANVLSKRDEEISKRNDKMRELRQAKKLYYFLVYLMKAPKGS